MLVIIRPPEYQSAGHILRLKLYPALAFNNDVMTGRKRKKRTRIDPILMIKNSDTYSHLFFQFDNNLLESNLRLGIKNGI